MTSTKPNIYLYWVDQELVCVVLYILFNIILFREKEHNVNELQRLLFSIFMWNKIKLILFNLL